MLELAQGDLNNWWEVFSDNLLRGFYKTCLSLDGRGLR
jgi:hypothetical protein